MITIDINDDYASIWNKDFNVYYGYEVTKCPEHGEYREVCDEEDCEKCEWCFKFEKDDTTLLLTKSEIKETIPDVEGGSPVRYLMAGLAILINNGYLDLQ